LSPRSRIAHGPNPCSRHCSSAARVSRNASSEFPDARACSASSSGERGVRISRAVGRTIACSAESPTERPFTPLIIARTLRGHSRTLAQATALVSRPRSMSRPSCPRRFRAPASASASVRALRFRRPRCRFPARPCRRARCAHRNGGP
jgi:hypothetical protein